MSNKRRHLEPRWWEGARLPTAEEYQYTTTFLQGSRQYLQPVQPDDPVLDLFGPKSARPVLRFTVAPWAIREGFLGQIIAQMRYLHARMSDEDAASLRDPEPGEYATVEFVYQGGHYCLLVEGITLVLPDPATVGSPTAEEMGEG